MKICFSVLKMVFLYICNKKMKLLCKLNFHKWNYISKTSRNCEICKKSEILINEGSVNGMSDFKYWQKFKK